MSSDSFKNATTAMGAIPGTWQVLADLRGALPGDLCGLTACRHGKARFFAGNSPSLTSVVGVGGLLAGNTSVYIETCDMTRRKPWTTHEVAILAARYPAEGASPELCSVLGRTASAVRRYALRLKIERVYPVHLTLIEHIKSRCEMQGDCWIWQGAHDNGRPRVRWGNGAVTIRRQILIEAGHRVRRSDSAVASCKTPLCVNPEHVVAVSRKRLVREYSQRMPESIRREINRKAALPLRKLSDADVSEIVVSTAMGRDLAAQYGVSESTISAYRTGRKTRAVPSMWRQLMR